MLLFLTLALLFSPLADDGGTRAGDVKPAADYEAALTTLLQRVVSDDGRVRYGLLRGELSEPFRRVLKAVEDYDPARLDTEAKRLAFWLNAYNVQMLQNIVETPGVEDVLAHGDKFFKTPYRTAGLALTLDQIEHAILRRGDAPAELRSLQMARLDPRIHVGLNCAAVSCPRLQPRAFTAAGVDAMLDGALRAWVNSPAHFRADGDGFVLSSLLDWFGADFDRPTGKAGDYLARYLSDDHPDAPALRRLFTGRTATQIKAHPGVAFAYDWQVNRF